MNVATVLAGIIVGLVVILVAVFAVLCYYRYRHLVCNIVNKIENSSPHV